MTKRVSEDLFLEIGELLNSNLDEASILRTFCNKILSLFDAERVSILSMGPQGKYLTLTAWAGRYPDDISKVSIPVGEGIAGWVAATGETLLVPDVDKDNRFAGRFPHRYRTRSFMSIPLKGRGYLLGVLNVSDNTGDEGFTEENLRTLRPLALQVGMGMENLRFRDRLSSLAPASAALVSALLELHQGHTDIESGLIPKTIEAMKTAIGPHSHLVILGEIGSNRAWVGRTTLDGRSQVAVMDYRSGFGLYQNLASLPLHSPYPESDQLNQLGFAWDLVLDGSLLLIRNLLPPRHNMFGLALSAVPPQDNEDMDILRNSQNILTRFVDLVISGILNRSQIQKLDHLKTELISTVSHELRTPLTSIQGFSELVLRDDGIPEPQRKYLSIINNESKRLNRMINNFLDLARLESGQLTLVKEPVDPVEAVENTVKLLKPQAETRGAMISLHGDYDLPLLIADRDRVEQVLVNLIGNAIKHGGSGVEIEVGIEKSEGQTVFEISDNGPGIPEEEQHLVFNRFYRGILEKDEDEDEDKGTGLGLPLTKEIIEQHGGTISVQSIPHQRTTFRFSLPTQGLISPQRGITAWYPGDENLNVELINRVAEGKTVGMLTIHVNHSSSRVHPDEALSVEDLSEIEEIITAALTDGGMGDDFVQSRPQGEFLVLTYASLVDEYASRLLTAFNDRFKAAYNLAIGAAVLEGDEEIEPSRMLTLSRQACRYVERTQKTGYLKNRRM
ncbi:MAG: GAF domain-containing sensor histidine kinase [bacterium]|nr:MAG: GAF domain-containing sensor histidine kinase [bacterium]